MARKLGSGWNVLDCRMEGRLMAYYWLIEVEGPRYLATWAKMRDFKWTDDASKALKFGTKESADELLWVASDKYRPMFLNVNPRAVLHGWAD